MKTNGAAISKLADGQAQMALCFEKGDDDVGHDDDGHADQKYDADRHVEQLFQEKRPGRLFPENGPERYAQVGDERRNAPEQHQGIHEADGAQMGRYGPYFAHDVLAVSRDQLPEQFLSLGQGARRRSDRGAQDEGEKKERRDERKGRGKSER